MVIPSFLVDTIGNQGVQNENRDYSFILPNFFVRLAPNIPPVLIVGIADFIEHSLHACIGANDGDHRMSFLMPFFWLWGMARKKSQKI
jgi:hypothetical protein